MKQILFTLILLLPTLCFGQNASPHLHDLRMRVAQNPADTTVRLEYAYQLAIANELDQAMQNYETILLQDPDNVSAAEGILWVLQSRGSYEQSIARAQSFLLKQAQSSAIAAYLAYGYSKTDRHLASLNSYKKADELAETPVQTDIAQNGLLWAYIYLHNYPAAQRLLKPRQHSEDSAARQILEARHVTMNLDFHSDYKDLNGIGLSASLTTTHATLSAKAEELILSGKRFREQYGLSLSLANSFAKAGASHSILRGIDKRIYPASTSAASISGILYWRNLEINPMLAAAWGKFQRLDTQQADIGLKILSDKWLIAYWLSNMYVDQEIVGSDSSKTLHSLQAGYKVFTNTQLQAYLFLGNQAWWLSPYQVIYDEYDANDKAIALSLCQKMSDRIYAMVYHQIGFFENEAQHSSSLNLSYSF
ncbi:MAG: hypothetical protein WCY87_01680 [Candidatus Cloacimonadales bacterium]|nr:hypothetical protein [Candidatus Cloacimonadota bacterium]MCB5256115.1 hypothetical protein [Candidatus Cloacimonadota bacterium]MCB5263344.1 hypothetical protein [Candidatus Cloacimonadota bacterium]MCB5276650.1 hypothetical protein [Candidatus Cloacimonadota bacterium]MDD2719194.1 hypothetical protein [Candidatus Cloacimonadota bacterium]